MAWNDDETTVARNRRNGKHIGYCQACHLVLAEFDTQTADKSIVCPRCSVETPADKLWENAGGVVVSEVSSEVP